MSVIQLSTGLSGLVIILFTASCTVRPEVSDFPRTATHAIAQQQTASTPLGVAAAKGMRAHPGQSGFNLVTSGKESLLVRLSMIRDAKKSIDLQYFSTREDTTGKLLLEEIMKAADRGVRVRMLLDDWNLDDFRAGAVALNHHPHIELRAFNPYVTRNQTPLARIGNFFTGSGQVMRRMHNKAMIVDNQVAISGGRNLGDEYFDASGDINFRDMDLLSVGPITARLSQNFDRYWNSEESYPVAALNLPPEDPKRIAARREKLKRYWERNAKEHPELQQPPLSALLGNKLKLTWAKAELAADRPEKISEPIKESDSKPATRLTELLGQAKNEFIVVTPYFVPMEEGVEWLHSLEKRGIRVRILTNSLASTDVVPAQGGYSRYREALLAGGVELYELKLQGDYKPGKHGSMFSSSTSQSSLHAKVYIIDRRDLVVGSFNLDPRSIYLNTEQVIIVHSPELSQQMVHQFERSIAPEASYRVQLADGDKLQWVAQEKGQSVVYESDPQASLWRSITASVFSVLPLDDQL